jgi:hypothetical protein
LSTKHNQDIREMPWSKRVSKLLLGAEVANTFFGSRYPETNAVCTEALGLCWDWLGDRNLPPEALARYLDADELDNPWMSEAIFRNDLQGLNALIFITLVIGHVAYLAYMQAGKAQLMSEIVQEAGDQIIDQILLYKKSLSAETQSKLLF